jgi:superfamily II DNA or RNA helicase
VSWGDWLGTGNVWAREFLPFGEAREFAHTLGLKSQPEWQAFCCSGKKPEDIPTRPEKTYETDWVSWGDWLGSGNVAPKNREFLSFDKAREFARALGFNSQADWVAFCRSGKRPENIPAIPNQTYEGEWICWADWLGALGLGDHIWTKKAIKAFLKGITPEIPKMRDASLVALITEAGLDLPLRELLGRVPMGRVVADLRDGGNEIRQRLRAVRDVRVDPQWQPPIAEEEEDFAHDEPEVNADNIHIADRLKGKVNPEFIERLIQEKVSGLVVKYIDGDSDVGRILEQKGGKYYREIRGRFESEVGGIAGVDTSSWKLRDGKTGEPAEPNRMQRYVAHKVKHNRGWGNWSGTGAGKTGSAGLASYVIGSRMTVVLCPNATVNQWVRELTDSFRGSRPVTDVAKAERGEGSFLILNYEKFQSKKRSAALVQAIVGLRPDMVVLDEVQLIKRRERERGSIRRETLQEMRRLLPDARVLGMTATPVINELMEGVSLLEAVTGKPQNLSTRRRGAGSVLDALNLHFALLRHGLRYKPKYRQSLSIKPEPFLDNGALPALRQAVKKGGSDVLAIERTILPAKLEQVRDRIKPGTLIYLEFVKGTVPVVHGFVASLGLTVGEYVGGTYTKGRDSVLKKFIAGELDVLIGSRAVGLGVDGLQKRCNRLIVLSLPWTHAAFEQLYGRVYRQGSRFVEVEVLIPQLVVTLNGRRWSWDESRYSVIEHKKTLADTATDGYVPTSGTVSRREFTKKALDALKLVIERTQDKTDSGIDSATTEAPASSSQEDEASAPDAQKLVLP